MGRQRTRPVVLSVCMISLLPMIGCLHDGPRKIPPPDFSGASVRIHSPVGQQVRTRQGITTAGKGFFDARTVSHAALALPEQLQPKATSRAWKYIVLHHTATNSGSVETIDREHRARRDKSGKPWLGIGYHFVIGNGSPMADGQIEATFRWHDQLHGAHAGSRDHNQTGIGICLVGDFQNSVPTARQVASAKRLVDLLARHYEIDPENIIPHGAVTGTKCPGRLFPMHEFSSH